MPAGMAIAMLAGPLFDGWRDIWWASAGLALAVGIAVPCVLPPDGQRRRWSWQGLAADATATVRAGGPL
ncbi:MFS transporter, partial [Paracoccus sp. PXZ]